MRLSREQLKVFDELGYRVMPDCFSKAHRDFTPIAPCPDDTLLQLARKARRASKRGIGNRE